MDEELQTINDFDTWVLAGRTRGLNGPFRTLGFDNHHFVDKEGATQAVWHGDKGHGTAPRKSDPLFVTARVIQDEKPPQGEEHHDGENG